MLTVRAPPILTGFLCVINKSLQPLSICLSDKQGPLHPRVRCDLVCINPQYKLVREIWVRMAMLAIRHPMHGEIDISLHYWNWGAWKVLTVALTSVACFNGPRLTCLLPNLISYSADCFLVASVHPGENDDQDHPSSFSALCFFMCGPYQLSARSSHQVLLCWLWPSSA